ncbi:MAG: hypothetical protein LBB14_01060, partial [Puniceicoccales bacterium]|nr:hypothetical protein [Puniceicoccales bacterium]
MDHANSSTAIVPHSPQVGISTIAPSLELAILRSVLLKRDESLHKIRFLIFLDVLFSIFSVILFPVALIRAAYNRATYGNFTLGWLFVYGAAASCIASGATG